MLFPSKEPATISRRNYYAKNSGFNGKKDYDIPIIYFQNADIENFKALGIPNGL